MNLRFGTVTASATGTATVTLDGVDLDVPIVNGKTSLTVGDTAILLQDGRRIVAVGAIAAA